MAFLEVKDIYKTFSDTAVLKGVSFDLEHKTATLRGYRNCTPHGYCVAKISGETAIPASLSFRQLAGDTFVIENIPTDHSEWKLELYYDTGYGWAKASSKNVIF